MIGITILCVVGAIAIIVLLALLIESLIEFWKLSDTLREKIAIIAIPIIIILFFGSAVLAILKI